ncbi:hypothetical protein KA005_32180, partial [bacterium]|nr:hypothetical protein [bacterium]
MKKKLVSIFVCMLLIFVTVFSVAGTMNTDKAEESLWPSSSYNSDNDGDVRDIVWDAVLSFNEPGGASDTAFFGEAPDANDGPPHDGYDVMKAPAPMPPYIRSWFNDNLPAPYDSLWKDYRQYPDTGKVWNLSVQWFPTDYVTPTDITISWDPSALGLSEYTGVVLYDVTGGSVVADMLVDTSYTYTSAAMAPKAFQIVCSVNDPPVFSDEDP